MGGGELTIPDSLRVFEEVGAARRLGGLEPRDLRRRPALRPLRLAGGFRRHLLRPAGRVRGLAQPDRHAAVPRRRRLAIQRQASLRERLGARELAHGCRHRAARRQPAVASTAFPAMRAGLFPIDQCTILDTWAVAGMRGTGSNDCVFEDVLVPDGFTFEWPEPRSSLAATGRSAPSRSRSSSAVPLATVALGVARHAIDELIEIAVSKMPAGTRASLRDRPLAQMQLGQAEGWLQAGRAYLHDARRGRVARGARRRPFDREARAAARLGIRHGREARGAGGRPRPRRRRHERGADLVAHPALLARRPHAHPARDPAHRRATRSSAAFSSASTPPHRSSDGRRSQARLGGPSRAQQPQWLARERPAGA